MDEPFWDFNYPVGYSTVEGGYICLDEKQGLDGDTIYIEDGERGREIVDAHNAALARVKQSLAARETLT